MAHEGSTGLLFPIKQMKNNVVFIESAIVELGDKEALIPIMLDPNNQISFKSGHCQVGDQVVILPAWARKDQFIAIKGWGAYEVAAESLVIFNKMDWTYDGYPGRCTTYASGYIWKERFYWSTIPPIPNGYPTYFKLQVMRKGLNGHPDTLIANWPQNCSDGTAVYEDDINVAYGNTTPYIAEDYPLAYGADYMHYFYTAFPKRDNICAVIIPELGSNYWIDDSFCPAYVEPPEENPKGIAVIQRTTTHEAENSVEEKYATLIALLEELPTFHYETEEELEAFLQEIRDATDALYSEIENYEIEEDEVWLNENKLYWTPTDGTILIRYKKSETPAYIVPDPVNEEYGTIDGHGDLLYYGPGTDGCYIHENLDYDSYYAYTIWNIETRLDEDSQEKIVYNRYTGDGYAEHYPVTATVYATNFIERSEYPSCTWDWSGWGFTRSANSDEGIQTTTESENPDVCSIGTSGEFGFHVNYIGGQYAWAKVTKTLSGEVSEIKMQIGCNGSTTLSSGGIRILVNGVEKWNKREDQFAITGSIGWLESTITLSPPVTNPIIIIERYHTQAFIGWFNGYLSSFYTT